MSRAMRMLMMAGGGFNPLALPDLVFFNSYDTVVGTGALSRGSGVNRSIGLYNPEWMVRTDLVNWAAYVGGSITLSGYVTGNNGTFSVVNGNTQNLVYVNATGSLETATGTGPQFMTSPGYCASYTDLRSGFVFAQSDITYVPAISTYYSRAKVLSGEQSRFMQASSAAIGTALNGTGDFTFFTFMRPTAVGTSGTPSSWISVHDAGGTSVIRPFYSSATSHTLTVANSSGAASNHVATLSPGLALNTWQLLAVTYSAPGIARWYLDGVLVGTSATGIVRTRSAMVNAFTGYRAFYPGGSGGTIAHRAVDGVTSGALSVGNLLALTAWCRANYT